MGACSLTHVGARFELSRAQFDTDLATCVVFRLLGCGGRRAGRHIPGRAAPGTARPNLHCMQLKNGGSDSPRVTASKTSSSRDHGCSPTARSRSTNMLSTSTMVEQPHSGKSSASTKAHFFSPLKRQENRKLTYVDMARSTPTTDQNRYPWVRDLFGECAPRCSASV